MRIAFASGKGGTGKTLLATSLAWKVARDAERSVVYADVDVEEPNGHLFLRPDVTTSTRISVQQPVPVPERCTGAKRCQAACEFNALMVVGTQVMVDPDLCHSCGACIMVCEDEALVEGRYEIGTLKVGRAGAVGFVGGVLDVGQARATPAVDATVAGAASHAESVTADLLVVDCPPGTSCAAMASVRGAELVVLVTEPTPFGLHDLRLAAEMCRALKRPIAAVINRSDLGDDATRGYLAAEGLPLLAALPFDREIATAYAEGVIPAERSGAVRDAVSAILTYADGLDASVNAAGEAFSGMRALGRA